MNSILLTGSAHCHSVNTYHCDKNVTLVYSCCHDLYLKVAYNFNTFYLAVTYKLLIKIYFIKIYCTANFTMRAISNSTHTLNIFSDYKLPTMQEINIVDHA